MPPARRPRAPLRRRRRPPAARDHRARASSTRSSQSRPEDRRAVIEEAAGVLKYRRRRERAERRLESSEQNLLRLQDLQREVRRQLRPLERQAEAARRHDGLVAELRALRLHLAGKEIAALERRLTAGEAGHEQATEREVRLKADLTRLDELVLATEEALGSAQAWDGAERLGRAERLAERAQGLSNVISERRRTIAGSLAATTEADVVSSLEAESSRLAGDLALAEAAMEALAPEWAVVEQLAAELTHDAAAFEARSATAEGAPPAAATPDGDERAGIDDIDGVEGQAPAWHEALPDARGAREARDAARDRLSVEREGAARLAERLSVSTHQAEELAGRLEAIEHSLVEAAAEADRSAAALAAAQALEEAAAERSLAAEAAGRAAMDRSHGLVARAEALQVALDEARALAGVERLAALDGVLGTLADVVVIDDGCERAFEAAVEDVLSAVVVAGRGSARTALRQLREAGLHGGVLMAGQAPPAGVAAGGGATVPAGAEPLRDRVRSAAPGVDALLDGLLAGVVLCRGGLDEALDLAERAAVVVTTEGDRLSWRGWRIGAAREGATRAALDQTRLAADSAVTAAELAIAESEAARAALIEARDAVARAARESDRWMAERRQLTGGRDDSSARLDRLRAEVADTSATHGASIARLGALEAELALRESELETAEGRELAARESAEQANRARQALDERARSVASLRAELEVRAAGLDERCSLLRSRREEIERRLAGMDAARSKAAERRTALESSDAALLRLSGHLVAVAGELEAARASLPRGARRARRLAGRHDDSPAGGPRRALPRRARADGDARAPAAGRARAGRGPSPARDRR